MSCHVGKSPDPHGAAPTRAGHVSTWCRRPVHETSSPVLSAQLTFISAGEHASRSAAHLVLSAESDERVLFALAPQLLSTAGHPLYRMASAAPAASTATAVSVQSIASLPQRSNTRQQQRREQRQQRQQIDGRHDDTQHDDGDEGSVQEPQRDQKMTKHSEERMEDVKSNSQPAASSSSSAAVNWECQS